MKGVYRIGRRGLTLVEVLVTAAAGVLITGALLGFSRIHAQVWQSAMADGTTQSMTQSAIQNMAPTIRAARQVVSASSSSARLTLQLPTYDPSGALIVPLQNGNVVSFYLSDSNGSPEATGGTILWRSVNGTPDDALKGAMAWEAAGADQLVFGFGPPTLEDSLRTIELLGKYVIPKLDKDPVHRTDRFKEAAAASASS